MGSSNSGRRNGKPCTDERRSLDVRSLQRKGLLMTGNTFHWRWKRHGETVAEIQVVVGNDCVVLNYQQRLGASPYQPCGNTVMLDWTGCHYGGRRPWWLCPVCGRRVAVLYSGRGSYSCRHCSQLAYRSQRETEEGLSARRANRVRVRLGWPQGILNLPGGKPKGMHWKTYSRLVTLHTAHSSKALAHLGASLKSLTRKLQAMG